MRVFLTGVACVGKTTVGARFADLLGCLFFDLDLEIERFYETSIERLQSRYLTSHSFRLAASRALRHVLSQVESSNWVIALPPSGLMGSYWRVVKKTQGATIVVLKDAPENILKRIIFYDMDSCQIQRGLTAREKDLYLRKVKGDITYFQPILPESTYVCRHHRLRPRRSVAQGRKCVGDGVIEGTEAKAGTNAKKDVLER